MLSWYRIPTKLGCDVHTVHSTVATGNGRDDDGGLSLHGTGESRHQLDVFITLNVCSLTMPRGGDVLGGSASEGDREVCSLNTMDRLVSWRL